MGDRSRRALLRQAEPGAPLPEQPAPLARCLFPLLHPGGPVAAHDLEHLRKLIDAARVSFEALWHMAEDVASEDPLYATEALRVEVQRRGREGTEQLAIAVEEVKVLADAGREGSVSRDVHPTGSMIAGLSRRFWWPRWALLPQVPSHTGKEKEGRIVDFLAIDLWAPPEVWIAHLIDEKASAGDTARQAKPGKIGPFAASCAFRWIACEPGRVRSIEPHVPEGYGLLSVGTGGEPRVILEAPEHVVTAPPDVDLVRGLLRAAGNASPPPARVSKIVPRRVVKAGRAAVTLLDVALAAIENADSEQLVLLDEALRARRVA